MNISPVAILIITMGIVYMIVGGMSRSTAGKAGIVTNSSVENVSVGIVIMGLLLLLVGGMLMFADEESKKKAASWVLPSALALSVITLIMTLVGAVSKDLDTKTGTPDQIDAKKNLKMKFWLIFALSMVTVVVVGGMMYNEHKEKKEKTVEDDLTAKFGFDFEF